MTVAKALPKDLIDGLLSGYQKPEDLIGEHGLLKKITKALVERALQAEMDGKNEAVSNATKNTRNGTSSKTLKGEFGEALLKLFYLAINNISKKWTMPIWDWKAALNRFTIQFEDWMQQQ